METNEITILKTVENVHQTSKHSKLKLECFKEVKL
jgi:hypothetical protein